MSGLSDFNLHETSNICQASTGKFYLLREMSDFAILRA